MRKIETIYVVGPTITAKSRRRLFKRVRKALTEMNVNHNYFSMGEVTEIPVPEEGYVPFRLITDDIIHLQQLPVDFAEILQAKLNAE